MSKWFQIASGGYGELMKDRHDRDVIYLHEGIMVPDEDHSSKAGICLFQDKSATLYYSDVLIMIRTKEGNLYKDWDPDFTGYYRDGKKYLGWSQKIGKAIKDFCGLKKSEYYELPWLIRKIR